MPLLRLARQLLCRPFPYSTFPVEAFRLLCIEEFFLFGLPYKQGNHGRVRRIAAPIH